MRIALSAGNAFAWIIIFEYFLSIVPFIPEAFARTALLYALSQALMCLLLPYTARTLRQGMQATMVWGILWCAATFVVLGALGAGFFGALYPLAIICFAFFLSLYRALYWIPYEVERNTLIQGAATDPTNWLSREILVALMPAFAGFLLGLHYIQVPALFFSVAALIIISLVPLVWVSDRYEGYPWSYREAFAQFFSRSNRRLVIGAIINGVQGAALLLVWPLAIFIIVGWSYPAFGAVLSLSLLVVMLMRGTMGAWMRRLEIHQSTSVRAAIAMSAWVGRLAAGNPLSIILVDTYSHGGGPRAMGIDHWNADQSSDMNTYVDEYTTLREMGMGFGRILACVIAALFALLVSIPCAVVVTFLIAAFCACISVMLAATPKPRI